MKLKLNPVWPVLKHYDPDHLNRIALPLGGIGTGTVSLGGRGDLRDWEIMNRPAKGFRPGRTLFALYAKPQGGDAVTRVLEGPIPAELYEGAHGSPAPDAGLPRFRQATFHAAYPLAQIALSDPGVPVAVRLEAFNPLIPPDADASGIPVAVFRFVLSNRTGKSVQASVCGVLENFIGFDGKEGICIDNRVEFREESMPRLKGLFFSSNGVDPKAEQYGTMALTTTGPGVTARALPLNRMWRTDLLALWDDFSEDGKLEGGFGDGQGEGATRPQGALASSVRIPPRGEKAITFLLTWHFPNRRTWTPAKNGEGCGCGTGCSDDPDMIGNYYGHQYRDAWDAAARTAAGLKGLEAGTVGFVRTFCETDIPEPVKEAALFNLSTLRSQTCFRTPDGFLYGWEGCSDREGSCLGSCTHVWNYEQALAFLFGDLARDQRRVEFLHATRDNGQMSFRVHLPLPRATEYGLAAADGQMGCLIKLYRDWQLSGDDAFLREVWPKARKAIEFCWIPGGWDADRDGVMEGCQHNTMDVEYYGPNGQMAIWYLGALRAAEEMARYLGEADFADTCRDLFKRGSAWIDENLFNGEYYEQEIRPLLPDKIAPGLRHETMGARDPMKPDFQLGTACLVDQLVGQFLAHICGLGYLTDRAKVRKTLRAIFRHNFRRGLRNHPNNMRTYVLNDESALLMATYPRGNRPEKPFPYHSEVMTGFEYTAAVGMIYEGQADNGFEIIRAIRDRYDGRRRSPFDEAECGHHYARALASWAGVLALSGFHYSGVDHVMTFGDIEGTHFWSNGFAWGACWVRKSGKVRRVELKVERGSLSLSKFRIEGLGEIEFKIRKTIGSGKSAKWVVTDAQTG
ncbi:hypothetical protein HQ520_15845 [bacterium]|nr:hypothetical protein [bacterium]